MRLPVYRRLDQGVDTSRNTETFDAVNPRSPPATPLYLPEGIGHFDRPAGCAPDRRRPHGAGGRAAGRPVQLVAAGLNFNGRRLPLPRVAVLYGKPFSIADLAAMDDEPAAVRATTDRIAAQMRRLLVEADPERDAGVVLASRRLTAPPAAGPRVPASTSRDGRRLRKESTAARARRGTVWRDRAAAGAVRPAASAVRSSRFTPGLGCFRGRCRPFCRPRDSSRSCLMPVAAVGLAIFWVPYQATGRLARSPPGTGCGGDRDRLRRRGRLRRLAAADRGACVATVRRPDGSGRRGAGSSAGARRAVRARTRGVGRRDGEVVAGAAAGARTFARLAEAERSEIAEMLEEVYEWLSAETRAPSAAQKPN